MNTGLGSNEYNFIVSKNYGGTGFALLARGYYDVKRFRVEANTTGSNLPVVGTSTPPTAQWVHVAGVSENGRGRLYVNGQLERDQAVADPPIANELALYVGSSPFGRDLNWQGVIDELRVWRVGRTQQEIQATMHDSLVGTEPGLVAYWRLDEGTGATAADSSGNANTATLVNVEWVTSYAPVRGLP